MTKAKKPPHDDSQIEEIDLSLIDTTSIDLSLVKDDSSIFEEKPKTKKMKEKSSDEDFEVSKDDAIDDLDFELKTDFEDDLEFMDEVFSRLAKLHIDLVDSLDADDMFKDAGKKKDEIDLSEISDDSIRMYLNEI